MKSYRFILLLLVFLATASLPVKAQEGLPANKLLRGFADRAYNCRKDARVIAISDSLNHHAKAQKNIPYQIAARVLPIRYKALNATDDTALLNELDEIATMAKRHHYSTYYYIAVTTFVESYYLRRGEIAKAQEMVKSRLMNDQGGDDNTRIIYVQMAIADVLNAEGEYALALRYYSKARDSLTEDKDKVTNGLLMSRIVGTLLYSGRLELVTSFIDEYKHLFITPQQKGALHAYDSFYDFMTGDFASGMSEYRKYLRYRDIYPEMDVRLEELVNTFPLIVSNDQKDQQALCQWMNGNHPLRDRLYLRYAYLIYHKRNKEADAVSDSILKGVAVHKSSDVTREAEEYATTIRQQVSEKQRQEAVSKQNMLKLNLAKLQLQNTNLELSHAENLKRAAQLEADRNAVSLDNRTRRAAQLRKKLQGQRTLNSANEQKVAEERQIFLFIIGLALVLLSLLLLYIWMHNKRKQRLNRIARSLESTHEEIEAMNKLALESDLKKTKFIQEMSHEVRTPLNSIVGFSQVLTDLGPSLSQEDRDDLTQRIIENSEQLSKLINDILDLTSLESGKYQMKKEPTRVTEICQKVIGLTQQHVNEDVEVRFDNPLATDFTIHTDPGRMEQMLVNLLDNAVKNTTQGNITLALSTVSHPGFVTFSVTDTGCGVPVDKMDDIFQRFHKVNPFKPGTGLGLDMCRVIAKQLGGEIDIDRHYAPGARFWFTLPA